MRHLCFPFPELLDGEKWDIEVTEQGGHASRHLHKIKVPVNSDKRSLATRCHELAHVKWSPGKLPDIRLLRIYHPMSLLAAEDARIQILQEEIGLQEICKWAPISDIPYNF